MKNILNYTNDWESDRYYVNRKPISALKKVSINGNEFDVKTKRVSINYTDHGHPGVATSNHYFITAIVNGIEFEKDLNTITNKTEIIALEWN